MSQPFTLPIEGVKVGHAIDAKTITGTTTVVFDSPATTGCHIMGAAPGTRETALLAAHNTVTQADAIVFSGGSAFGLESGGGVMNALASQGKGFPVGEARVPIVPGAILFDLNNGGDKRVDLSRLYLKLGEESAKLAASTSKQGSIGAGFGATTAGGRGGLGFAAEKIGDGNLFAMAAVNAVGSPLIGASHHYWAAPFEKDKEYGGFGMPAPWPDDAATPRTKGSGAGENTTLGLIVTDFQVDQAGATRLAMSAHDGFARALYPVHTPFDGDIVFAASTNKRQCSSQDFFSLCILAANAMARAIAAGCHHARYPDTL